MVFSSKESPKTVKEVNALKNLFSVQNLFAKIDLVSELLYLL